MPKRAERPAVVPAEPILADAAYLLEDFAHRVRMGRHALRACRRRGLRTIRAGGRMHVLGADWLDYLRAQADAGDHSREGRADG